MPPIVFGGSHESVTNESPRVPTTFCGPVGMSARAIWKVVEPSALLGRSVLLARSMRRPATVAVAARVVAVIS